MTRCRQADNIFLPLFASGLVLIFLLSGCQQEPSSNSPNKGLTAKEQSQTSKAQPPSLIECQQLGLQIQNQMKGDFGKDTPYWMDFDATFKRSIAGLDLDQKMKDIFYKGLKQAMQTKDSFRVAKRRIGQWGSFNFLRLKQENGEFRLLFRMISNEGGINYLEAIVERNQRGFCSVVDVFNYSANEKVSQMYRRIYELMEPAGRKDLKGDPTESQLISKHIDKMEQARNDGDYKKVLELIENGPDVIRKLKVFHSLRVFAAIKVDDEKQVQRAVDDYRKNYGNDPSLDLLLNDFHVAKKDYASAMECINRLDSRVKDPFLDYFRAIYHLQRGELAESRKLAKAVREYIPDSLYGHIAGLEIALKEKEFDRLSAILDEIGDRFDPNFDELLAIPVYDEFKNSDEFREWTDRRSKQKIE